MTSISKPMISVVMPSYNHDRFIGRAISSVLNQDYGDFELLIGDDCSTDDSIDVIKSFSDERIHLFFFKRNQGACECLNFLIGISQGKYIALLNSDDEWETSKLKKQIRFLEQNKNYSACLTWADLIDEKSQKIKSSFYRLDLFNKENRSRWSWLGYFFFHGNCFCHPSVLIRSDIYLEIGLYNPAYRQAPDFDFWLRLLVKYEIYVYPEILVHHRRLNGSVENTSATTPINTQRNRNEFTEIMRRFFWGLDDEKFLSSFSGFFRRKHASSHEELVCEKYFLLLDNPLYGHCLRSLAITLYVENICSPSISKAFNELYSYYPSDFYDLTGNFEVKVPLGYKVSRYLLGIFRHPCRLLKRAYLHIR